MVDDLMRRAWEAVEKSGVPEALQETAFKEAVAMLRDQEEGLATGGSGGGGGSASTSTRTATRRSSKKTAARTSSSTTKSESESERAEVPDEATFFSQLADASEVDEQDLRDILQLTAEGEVRVTTPKRRLGSTTLEQARNVVALVAGARAKGLGERPVDARAVRAEVERKNCYDVGNFSNKHLGPMRGFNAAGRNEIVLTSRWDNEFRAAVDKAHGRSAADQESTQQQ